MVMDGWIDETHRFWFEELKPDDWFEPRPRTDAMIRQRFLAVYERLADAVPDAAAREPRAALASVLVYDQFPRNLFRGTARAFATDRLALTIARDAVQRKFDEDLTSSGRKFLYMPFMHSEQLADQERSVALFRTVDDDSLKFAIEHRDIIARFGRFPHRNVALGRESAAEELEFLRQHEGFGQ